MDTDSTAAPEATSQVMGLVAEWNETVRALYSISDEDEDANDQLADHQYAIEDRLIGVPSESWTDVIAKLEVAMWSDPKNIEGDRVAAIERDIRRLNKLDSETTVTFDPAAWFARFTSAGGACHVIDSKHVLGSADMTGHRGWARLLRELRKGDAERLTVWLQEQFPLGRLQFDGDPAARFGQAEAAYNSDQISENDYHAALRAMDDWTPTTTHDLARKFYLMHRNRGCPTEERVNKLLADASALLEA